jgi:hypothetical protein
MIWSHVAHLYMSSFERARRVVFDRRLKPLAIQTLDERPWELPKWRLEHLIRMTDSTGLLQHAKYTLPNLSEGYCTDDNARALRFAVYLEELELDTPEIQRLMMRYAAFVDAAFDPQRRRFRNFMTFDRQWVHEDDLGSDDCFGRVLWALGAFVARSKRSGLRAWAMDLFLRALPASLEMRSPRAWASALIGIDEYLSKLSGDPEVLQIQAALLSHLMGLHEQIAGNDWQWFESGLSYENALLPHALILSGHRRDESEVLQVGLRTLGWLTTLQRAPRGHFRPIGSNGFYQQNSGRADFDQQPIEACATVAASIAAYRVTEHPAWLNEARLAFEWFLGRNDLAAQVYDPSSGGCHDGLHVDRVNENQGAESTLAFLLSLAELGQLESSLAAFRQAAEVPAGVSNGAPHR